MKRIITRLAIALTVICGAGALTPAKAQIPVTDAANLSQSLVFSIQEAFDAATQIGHLFEQIGIAKDTYQTFKTMYEKVSPWLQKAQQVTRLLRRTAYAYNSMSYYSDYIQSLARDGHITPRKLGRLASSASSIINEIEGIAKDTKEIFKGNNSFTTGERLAQSKEQDKNLQELLDAIQLEIVEVIRVTAKENFSNNTASGLSALI